MSPEPAVGWLLGFVEGRVVASPLGVLPLGVLPLGVSLDVPSPLAGAPLRRRWLSVPSRVEMKVMTGSLSRECRLRQAGVEVGIVCSSLLGLIMQRGGEAGWQPRRNALCPHALTGARPPLNDANRDPFSAHPPPPQQPCRSPPHLGEPLVLPLMAAARVARVCAAAAATWRPMVLT